MAYESVDALQKALVAKVFHDRADTKKAAGRALGTIVELITFYLLREWGLLPHLVIEVKLPEFGCLEEIKHNVEFTLHPLRASESVVVPKLPVSAAKVAREMRKPPESTRATNLLSAKGVLRNAAVVSVESDHFVIGNVDGWNGPCSGRVDHRAF